MRHTAITWGRELHPLVFRTYLAIIRPFGLHSGRIYDFYAPMLIFKEQKSPHRLPCVCSHPCAAWPTPWISKSRSHREHSHNTKTIRRYPHRTMSLPYLTDQRRNSLSPCLSLTLPLLVWPQRHRGLKHHEQPQ